MVAYETSYRRRCASWCDIAKQRQSDVESPLDDAEKAINDVETTLNGDNI